MDEIRDYADWLDATATPLVDLVPPMVEAPAPVPPPDRRAPAWTRGVVALAAVILIGVPLAMLLDGFGLDQEPADTITAFPVEGPVVLVADEGTMLLGKDHPPGAIVEVELNGPSIGEGVVGPSAEVGTDGRFEVTLWPELGLREGDAATVTVRGPSPTADGAQSYTVPYVGIRFDLLDPVADLAVGTAQVPDGTPIQVRIEQGTELTVAETETFNGAWEVDLSAVVDVTLESVGTAWVPSGDGFSSTSPRSAVQGPTQLDLIQGNWFLQGNGWLPGAQADLIINGETQPAPITIGPGGRFEIFLESYGLASGDVVGIDDGQTDKSITVHDIVVTDLDQAAGVIAGSTDLADGTIVVVGHDRGAGVDVAVEGGRFSASFEPGSIGYPDVGFMDADQDWLAGTVDPAVEAEIPAGGAPAATPTDAGQWVTVLADGPLEIAGSGFAEGARVSVEVLVGGVSDWEDGSAATVDATGSFASAHPSVNTGNGTVVVTVGEQRFEVPIVPINLVLVFEDTGDIRASVGVPDGTQAEVHTAVDGEPISISTTVQDESVSVSATNGALLPGTTAELWVESGDGWVINRSSEPQTRIEWFVDGPGVHVQWLLPGEELDLVIDGAPDRTVVTDEFGTLWVSTDAPTESIVLTNERITLTMAEIPEVTISGFDGNLVSGAAALPGSAVVSVDIWQGVNYEAFGEVPVRDGVWSVETALEGPGRIVEVRWTDGAENQVVRRFEE
jgi:hypothetical protein